jgi:ABC-type antimicrobial peptide transport system permease subunit
VRGRSDDTGGLRAAVAAAVTDVAPDATFRMTKMADAVRGITWVFQAFSVTALLLGIVGLVLAYSGTHAVVSFLVAQRRREFGVRMALGATSARIVWGMMSEMSRIVAVGLASGLLIVAALVGAFGGSIPIVPEFGPRPYLFGAAIVVAATAIAALLPLRGAARIDPAQALRAE